MSARYLLAEKHKRQSYLIIFILFFYVNLIRQTMLFFGVLLDGHTRMLQLVPENKEKVKTLAITVNHI